MKLTLPYITFYQSQRFLGQLYWQILYFGQNENIFNLLQHMSSCTFCALLNTINEKYYKLYKQYMTLTSLVYSEQQT